MRQAKHDSNTVYYFSDATIVGCFSLSLPLQMLPIYLNEQYLKQDVLKQPEANTELLYFSALSYYKCSVEKKSLYLLSHFRIGIMS